MPAVVDDDVQLAADLLGPALEDGEVALVARDGLVATHWRDPAAARDEGEANYRGVPRIGSRRGSWSFLSSYAQAVPETRRQQKILLFTITMLASCKTLASTKAWAFVECLFTIGLS